MAIFLDPATQAEYWSAPTTGARAGALINGIAGTVTCKIFDDADIERASGTFVGSWGAVGDGVVTVNAVTVTVANGGEPTGNWYMKIASGARWLTGSFGLVNSGADFRWSGGAGSFKTGSTGTVRTVTLTVAPVNVTAPPACTTLPVIAGTPRVGQTLYASTGVWTGTPTPTLAYQWYADGLVIAGATQATFSLTSAQLASLIDVHVTGTNSAGSVTVESNVLGPVTTAQTPLTFAGLPEPIPLYRNGTYSVASFVSGGTPPYSYDYTGTLPTGVQFNTTSGLFSVNATATLGDSLDVQIGVSDSEVVEALVTLSITSASGGTNLPFTFGHVFKQGAVRADQYVNSDLADWQVTPRTRWPDGSLKTAVISGRATCAAGVPRAVALTTSSTDRAGATLTESAITASGRSVVVTFAGGVVGTVRLSDLIGVASSGVRGSAGRVAIRQSGPVVSEFKYYSSVGSDPHLAVFITTRIYVGGRAWSRVTVENGWWNVAAPGTKTYTCTVQIDGATAYNSGTSISHAHHGRWSLEFWHGGDPAIVPTHDRAYIKATKLVPNYVGGVDSRLFGSLVQTYTPFAACNLPITGMGAPGYAGWIGLLPEYDAACMSSADPRVWKAMIANSHAYGMYALCYRDENTLRPVAPLTYPQWTLNEANVGIADNAGNSAQVTPAPTAPAMATFAPTHHPAPPYLAALLTGDDFYVEQVQFAASTLAFIDSTNTYPSGRIRGALNFLVQGTYRDEAWRTRTLFLAAAISDPGTELETNYRTIVADNVQNMRELFVDGSALSGAYRNNVGIVGAYVGVYLDYSTDPTQGYDAPWQYMFKSASIGYGADLGISFDAVQQGNLDVVRNFSHKWVVDTMGDGVSAWCYRFAATYAVPVCYDASNPWGTLMPDARTRWIEYVAKSKSAPLPDSSCNDGSTMFVSGGSGELSAVNWYESSSFIAMIANLAYAVDAGITGAASGYARFIGSSTYSLRAASVWASYPLWAIAPRAAAAPFQISASSSGRYLQRESGQPFFVHGDAAWSLAVACTRAQIATYLNDRAGRGFNSIVVNLIEHYYSDNTPAWKNAEGYEPFATMSPVAWSSPTENYWNLIDYIINEAAKRGMLVFAFPTYAGYSGGAQGWHSNIIAASQADMLAYGRFLGQRYMGKGNVVWCMYGDFAPTSTERQRYRDVIDGIKTYDTDALVTAHASRGLSSREAFSDAQINVDVTYTGIDDAYFETATAYARTPTLPTLLIEGYYEGNGSGTPARVRAQPWTTLLAGGCGHHFGHETVWRFGTGGYGGFAGAQAVFGSALTQQMAFVKAMTDSVPWHLLQPKTGAELVTSSLSSGPSRICPALASDGSFALVWVPTATSPTINLAALAGPNVAARWYDPTLGTYSAIGSWAASGTRTMTHPGNNAAGTSEWVLRLDTVA